jgi:FkbM family methyltransferase
MEKKLRALLLQILGTEKYLTLVSRIYIRMIKAGMLKGKYPELFYLEQLIQPGFICIDIGANVGYYSTYISKLAGPKGQVHAVEPIALFQNIFTKNIQAFNCTNITLHPVALGGKKGSITMGTPMIDGVFRHGLTHVVESDENTEDMHTYTVNMCTPEELFLSMNRLDFIKCDVEGYETILMPHFMGILNRFRPMIQIELGSEENRKSIVGLFATAGYAPYQLNNGTLQPLAGAEALNYSKGDFYFKH